MVPFAGWNMPVQYTGIIDEHNTVRSACGVFDISHMGQFLVSGEGATEWLNSMFTNNLNKLVDGMGQYSIMPLENEAPRSTPTAATATAPVYVPERLPIEELRKLQASLLTPTTRPKTDSSRSIPYIT
jgi:hypothetical protein